MPLYKIYTMFSILKHRQCVFLFFRKQSGIWFIVEALFDNFAYLNSLYSVVEVHTNLKAANMLQPKGWNGQLSMYICMYHWL